MCVAWCGDSWTAYIGEEDDRKADGGAAEALHNAARAIDEATARCHIPRQHHLRPRLELQARLALRPPQ